MGIWGKGTPFLKRGKDCNAISDGEKDSTNWIYKNTFFLSFIPSHSDISFLPPDMG